MYMCVCVCVYVYVYIYIYIHIYIHIFTRTQGTHFWRARVCSVPPVHVCSVDVRT